MNYDVVKAEYIDGYRLKLQFSDGASGVVDFLPFIEKGGVFTALQNTALFKDFDVDPSWNTVTWQDGELDIAPETLYREATGGWPVQEHLLNVAEDSPKYGTDPSVD